MRGKTEADARARGTDGARAEPPARPGVARNAGYNLAGQVAPALVAVATMPVVVRELGPAAFGLLALAWTVVGYFGLFDLGFGRAATQRVATLASAAGAWEDGDAGAAGEVADVAATVAVVQALLGTATGLLLWAAAPPLAAVLASGPMESQGVTVLRLLAMGLPAVLVMNAQRAVLEGLSRFDLVNAVRAPFTAALFLIPLAGVLAGGSLAAIVLALVASRWLAAAVYGWLSHRALGRWGRVRGAELRRLARFGGWVAVSNLIVPLVVYLERIVVSARGGTEALGYYAAPHELMMRLLIVPAAIAAVLYPLFASLRARAAAGALAEAVGGGVRVVAVLFAPVALIFILFAPPLLEVWLGAVYGERGGLVLRILATAAFLNALVYVPFALIEGIGRPDVVARYHLAELPVYGGLLWVFTGAWGIPGAAAAWLLRMGWTTPLFFGITLKLAGIAWRDEALRGALRASAAGMLVLVAAHGWVLHAGGTPPVGPALLLPAGFAAVAWRWLLLPADRVRVRGWLRRMRRSREPREYVPDV